MRRSSAGSGRAIVAGLTTLILATGASALAQSRRPQPIPDAGRPGAGPIAASTAAGRGTPPAAEAYRLPPLPETVPASSPAASRPGANAEAPTLIPGQVVQPIDLASALRLAGAVDLDIATARQQVMQALGELDEARGLWLPSLFTGPTYYRLDGQVQSINGQVQTVSRNSLFFGSTASLANSFPAAPPGSGFPPLNSLSGVLRLSDAIYGTRAVRHVIAANEAGVEAATNNALLAVSEAYFDLQLAAGTLAIAREATGNADVLAGLAGTFAKSGAGRSASPSGSSRSPRPTWSVRSSSTRTPWSPRSSRPRPSSG
jgi:hypothetical protein